MNAWSHTSIPHCFSVVCYLIKQIFMAWYLVKHSDNFIFGLDVKYCSFTSHLDIQ